MLHAIKLEVVKSPSGQHWWVVAAHDKHYPFAVRDTKWEAEQECELLQRTADAHV